MFKSSVDKLYENLEKQTLKKDFGDKDKEEVFRLIWLLFSDYTNISKNDESKFIDQIIEKIDEFFDRGWLFWGLKILIWKILNNFKIFQ